MYAENGEWIGYAQTTEHPDGTVTAECKFQRPVQILQGSDRTVDRMTYTISPGIEPNVLHHG